MSNPYGTWTLFKRETKRFMKVYVQTILSPVVSNLLFLAVFGLSLKRTVPVEGVTYLEFLVPGLIMMGIINSSYMNPSSSIIIMKFQGLVEHLMTIPLKKIEILIAFISSAILRGMIVGTVTYLSSLFFVDFTYHSIPVIFASAILVALFFGAFGMVVGIWAKEFDKMAFIQNFVLTPLIFLGGVFYPITTLPETFQKISAFNPIIYMIDLLRYGFTGIAAFPVWQSFLVLTVATALVTGLSYFMLKKGYRLQT